MKFQLFAPVALCSTALFAQNPAPSSLAPGTPAPALRQPPSLAAPTTPVAPDAVVLTIGTTKITRAEFEQLVAALAENGRPLPNAAAKRQVAQQFGQLMALSDEARKRKLDQTPAAKQMINIQVDSYLVNALQRQVADQVKPDDAALHAYYDAHKNQYEQIKAKHILIRFKGSQVPVKTGGKDLTEDEALAKAKDIEKQIAGGGDFAALAKAESDDTGTATNGGTLPPFSRGQMVPEFEQAVLSQPIGKVSDPVKTKFGYHIILVDDRSNKSFDEAKADIEKQVKPSMVRDAMDKLEKQTPVTLDDNYFGPVIGSGTVAPVHPPVPAPTPAH